MSDIRRVHGSGNQMHCHRDDHEPWREILRAREAAHEKHGDNSIESIPWFSDRWLSILVEEIGELAHELTYDAKGGKKGMRSELIDILAVASAWLSAMDETS